MLLETSGERAKGALRLGAVVIVALRLGAASWEPLYAMSGLRRVELPPDYYLPIRAVAALEAALFTQ